MAYIDEEMPPETPLAFGLHPNAEIGFKLREGVRFCSSIAALHPQSIATSGGLPTEEKVCSCVLLRIITDVFQPLPSICISFQRCGLMQAKVVLDELLEKLPDQMDLADIRARVDELTPFLMVALQVKQ